MCGIAGILNFYHSKKIQINDLENLVSILNHRGPDESGGYIDDMIALGHSRLSIIGLDDGVQPIHNEDSNLWITYNGEIYNYIELRKDLIKRGHRFLTNTDTEVIVHLYEEKGVECLNYLNGQFAFAIWDRHKKELFLARDRLGIRPLHYTFTKSQFIFSSEIKSIFTQKSVKRSIDFSTLNQIFTYWTPLSGNTFFENIKELPPAHYLILSAQKYSLKKYWDLPFYNEDEKLNWSLDKITEKINELLYDSIRLRLRADVPVGAYLSGGLDSSAIASTVKSGFNNELKTFGIRFEDAKYDEGSYQTEIVKKLNTDHHEIFANNVNISRHFSETLWYIEKPVLRTAAVPLYILSNTVKKNNLKVVLTGEGADEFFGGYNIFREAKVRWFWSKNQNSNFRPMLLAKLYPYILNDDKIKRINKLFFGQDLENVNRPYFSHQIRWDNTQKVKRFLLPEVKQLYGNSEYNDFAGPLLNDSGYMDYFEKAQYLEVNTLLSNYLLSSQGDRVAMANSIEVRFPYLDHRLIDFMAKVPSRLKIYGMNEKFLLKRAFRNKLPESIIRHSKYPYRAPIKNSLLSKSNSANIEKYCSPDALKIAGIFDPKYTDKLIGKVSKSKNDSEWENMAISGIYSAQVLYDKFIKNFHQPKNTNFKFDLLVDYRNK